MMYRNDLCCKQKVAYDMEGAATRWDSHSGKTLYLCEACGFVHFASNNDSRMDRRHERALRMEERRKAHAALPIVQNAPCKKEKKNRAIAAFEPKIPSRFSADTTCRVSVWKASGASIGDILAWKDFERLESMAEQ